MKKLLRTAIGWIAFPALSIALALALIAGWGQLFYGSAYALPAIAKGKVVIAEPGTRSIGVLEAGGRYQADFTLTNLTSGPILVNGARANCTCVVADKLPLEIPAHGRQSFRLAVSPAKAQAGQPFSQSVNLYLSVPSPQVTLTVLGTVAGGDPSSL